MKIVIVLGLLAFTSGIRAQPARLDSLLKLLPETENGPRRIDVLNQLAFLYSPVAVEEAEKFVVQAVAESRAIQYDAGTAEAFKILGVIYYVRGDFAHAAEYQYKALKIYEALNDRSGQGKVLNNLALIFIAEKDFGRVYEFTMRSLALKRAAGDSTGVANSNLALAEFYLNINQFEKAKHHCREALNHFERGDDNWGRIYALYHMGEIYHRQQDYQEALRHYREVIRYASRMQHNIQLITTYNKLGQLFMETGQPDSAYRYLHQARHIAIDRENRANEMEAAQLLADYFVQTKLLDSALYYTKASSEIEREISQRLKSDQIATMQTLYNFEKKDQELSFHKRIVRRQYAAIISVSIILVLSVVFGIKLYRLNKTNRQAKDDLIKLNLEIHSMNQNLESLVQARTEEIRVQNQKLLEYAFFTAHEVRGPVARILGLIELAKLKELDEEDRSQILARLEETGYELDNVIHTISRKLEKRNQAGSAPAAGSLEETPAG
ncbi:MAG TPA: tetratricopeptide repeat protein [Ohtaekwangia sp.]|nr:tetratricopeptide repeat protein [Ohtaekwangia sp.]